MLKEVLAAVLKRGFLLDDPIHQIWRAETRGWNKGKSMSSSLHLKFLKEKSKLDTETDGAQRVSGQCDYYCTWHCNDGSMSLRLCPSLQMDNSKRKPHWKCRDPQIMTYRCMFINCITFWLGILIVGEAVWVCCGGDRRCMGKFRTFCSIFL